MPKKAPSKKTTRKKTRKHGAVKKHISTGGDRYASWLHPSTREEALDHEVAFTDNPNWRIFRIMAEFIDGYEFLSKLKGEVTIFGSARAMPGSKYYQIAKELGYLLGKGGYTTITGGGPGIMEAANWGAFEAGGVSVGLDIELATEQRRNQFATKAMGFHHFFTRKVMLSASAQAYVFFPGGFGTMDEMTEMVTLIQTAKIPPDVPVILVGKKFWKPFFEWVRQMMCDENRFVEKEEIAIMHLVDTPQEVMKIIKTTSERAFG